MASLQSLHVYPLKSARGIEVARALLSPAGLDHDREWLLVTPDGHFMTQREFPRLALLRTELRGPALCIAAPGMPALSLDAAAAGSPRRVRIWNDDCDAIDAGEAAADWASRAVGTPCRLVRFDGRQTRLSARAWTGDVAAPNRFSDAFPLLIANSASLQELNERLARPLPMNRFRPNLVLDGLAPWEEDRVAELIIGPVRLRLVKPCTRCRITTIDQDNGLPAGEEPLRTLRRYRYDAALQGILFAQNAIILSGVGTWLARGAEVALRWK
jgi:uncharacterized protein YcbX